MSISERQLRKMAKEACSNNEMEGYNTTPDGEEIVYQHLKEELIEKNRPLSEVILEFKNQATSSI